jgi:hypothetical protein
MSFVGANISIIVDGDASNTKRHSRKALDVSQGLMNEKLRLSPGKVSSNDDTVNTGRWVSSYKIKATSNVI